MTTPATDLPLAYAGLGDRELVSRCLVRDEEAWRTLLARYSALIYSIPLRYRLGRDFADDVFQSVATTLFERLQLIADPTCLPKWILVTTVRRAQRMSRERVGAGAGTADAGDPADPAPTIETAVIREQTAEQVRAALAELPSRDREILIDLFQEELPYAAVARRHQVAIGTLGSLRARALTRLRRVLLRRGVR